MISITSDPESNLLMSGTVEHFEADKCKSLLSERLSEIIQSDVQIDVSELTSVSSVTLAFLLFGLREAKLLSKNIYYKNMPPTLFNMARVSSIETILVSD